MNPAKWQDTVKKTAEELQIDEAFLKELSIAYWKEIRKEIAEINKPRIEVRGLGCFDLKHYKVKYVLRDTVAFIRYHEKSSTPRSLAILENLKRKQLVLERANMLAEKKVYKKLEKRSERKKYIEQKQNSNDLGKSLQDL